MLSLVLFALFVVQGVVVAGSLQPRWDEPDGRVLQLRAATRWSDLARRDTAVFHLTHSAELVYTSSENNGDDETFYSSVKVSSEQPILVLEEIENLVKEVQCSSESIRLQFTSPESFAAAELEAPRLIGGYIITSHQECHDHDSRLVFKVTTVSANAIDSSLSLGVTEVPWKTAFDEFKIGYGHSKTQHIFRSTQNLARIYRRQAPTGTASAEGALASSIIPSASPTSTSVTINAAYKEEDTIFESFISHPVNPITIGCALCKIDGTFKLTQGEITVVSFDGLARLAQTNASEPIDFIRSGYAHVKADGFAAHINLMMMPSLSGSLSYTLFQAPISGFLIPRIGKAGIMYESALVFDWSVRGVYKLTYGFEAKIPDGSSLNISIAELQDSSVTGFQNTTFTALPFQANLSNIDASLSITHRPQIHLAFDFLDFLVLSTGTYINAPTLKVGLSVKAPGSYNAQCEAVDSSKLGSIKNALYNLTHIQPEAAVGIGLVAEARADVVMPVNLMNLTWHTQIPLGEVATALPTRCLAGRTGAKGEVVFAAATAVVGKAGGEEGVKSEGERFRSSPIVLVLFWGIITQIVLFCF